MQFPFLATAALIILLCILDASFLVGDTVVRGLKDEGQTGARSLRASPKRRLLAASPTLGTCRGSYRRLQCEGFAVWDLGFGFRGWGSGFRVWRLGFRV